MDNTGKKNRLIQILKILTRQEKLIVVLYYYEELTMREIAKVLEFPVSKVKQMHTSLIRKLKIKI